MALSRELEECAMDLTVVMAATEISRTLGIGMTGALKRLLCSDTGAKLYDRELKYWADGPSAAAHAFIERETQAASTQRAT